MSNYSVQAAKDAAKKVANHNSLDIKNGACLLSATVTGACGERTLTETQSLLEGEVLDSKLLSGTKLRWFPKKALNFVGKYSTSARRTLSKHGVAFGKGTTMIPIATLDQVIEELEQVKSGFLSDLSQLKSEYDDVIAEHMNENQDIAHHIQRCVEEVDRFASRFSFEIHPPMAIQPLFDGDEVTIASSAAGTLLEEIADEAEAIYRLSFSGREKATAKKMKPVFGLRDKLLNLSFLDASISRVVLKFDEILSKLPKTYPLEDGDFHTVCHFLTLVSDESKLKSYGNGGDDLDDTRNQTQSLGLEDDDDVDSNIDSTEVAAVSEQNDVVESSSSIDTSEQIDVLDDLSGLEESSVSVGISGSSDDWNFEEW